MFFTLILSVLAIIGVTIALNEILNIIGVFFPIEENSLDLSYIISIFSSDLNQGISLLGFLAWAILQLYGIPLIVFLVSLHGLTTK